MLLFIILNFLTFDVGIFLDIEKKDTLNIAEVYNRENSQ